MGNGDDRDAPPVNRWQLGLTCAAIVATGYLVAWLVHEPEPAAPAGRSYITPPVEYPVQIPGCDAVEPPRQPRLLGASYFDEYEYDNPSYPWFSGPKAGAMTQALRAALPGDVDIAFAPVTSSLVFQPILGEPPEDEGFGDSTAARATLLRSDRAGRLMVTVRRSGTPIPRCVAGALDERRHLPDGTIIDIHDTWYEIKGYRTLSRTATGYLPDASVVRANATGEAPDGRARGVPLTIDELVALVTDPALRVSTPVPPGTANPPESCMRYLPLEPVIDQAQARRWDAVLARIPLDGVTLDRPLGALLPGERGGVCQTVRVTTPGLQSRLIVEISIGKPLPQEADASPYDRATRRLPDGAVVESTAERTAPFRTVTVTRPSGVQVRVSSADASDEPLPFAMLEEIALDPEFEVSR
ncbi:hypothetical protein [Nocardia sp. NPDC057227]|uniref:hypothetical protein n=1 Tax=Nocardia sp. NPDC057227 TaxID=3346056 RepID=UPI00362D2C71